MRRRSAAMVLLGLALTLGAVSHAFGADAVTVTSAELIERSSAFDGRRVIFIGEAIGELMVRGEHAWLHINDDAYADRIVEQGGRLAGFNSGLGVWAPAHLARRVRTFGGYRRQGDRVRIEGAFNAACDEHGGDADIHAVSVEVLARGRAIPHELHRGKIVAVVGLGVLVTVLMWAERRKSARERVGLDGPPRTG